MSLMAAASPPFPFPSSSSSSTRHLRRAATTTASAASSTSDEFDYPLVDPSVRWPHLRFPHLPAPRFPAATVPAAPPAPARPPRVEDDDDPAETPASASALVEPLDARAHRGRVKRLSKLALRRARDWRARVAGLADAVLALAPGAPVDDVLEGARAAPDEVSLVVRTVGESSWRRALDVFEWLARSGAPAPRAVAVVIGVLGRARQDAVAEELFLRFAGEGATVQVFNAMMGVYARSGRFDDARQLLDTMHERGIEPDLVSFNTLINARAKSGCLAAGVALDLLFEVRQAGLRPDVITYNTLISACSQSSNLEDAVTVFEEMMASECRPDLWTYNAMVSVHGRCGKAEEAERLFGELVEKGFMPDAVTYNSLLYAFAKEGDVDKVERTCEDLVKAGFRKNEITYNTMIHMYGKMGRLDLLVGLYDEMRSMGCTPDSVTYTVLIDSLGKMDRIAEAGKVLEEMAAAGLKPTLVTFSALICAYAKGGRWAESEKTFDCMVASGVKPDRLAYLVMLDVFARSGETEKLLDLYRKMMKDSYRPDDGLYQVLLAALAKEDKHEEIEEVIQDMELLCQMNPGIISTILIKARCISQGAKLLKKACLQGYKPDIKSLRSIMDAYVTTEKQEEGLSLLECIREHVSSSHDLISEFSVMLLCRKQTSIAAYEEYNRMQMFKYESFGRNCNLYEYLITCLEEAEFFSEACQVYCDMQFIGIEASKNIYESMISTYCKLGFPETAHRLMDDALQSGIPLNVLRSRVLIIEAYGKIKLWQQAEILVKGLRQSSGIDRRIWNALIHAYAESGLYEKARAVFDNMIKAGPLPTVDSINGMMRALIVDGRLDELYVVVQELQDMDFKISKSTVLLMLDAFAKGGDVFEVMKIYNGMKAAGYLPNMHLYRSMISLLCRHNRSRDVELMIAEMEAAGFKPDVAILNALLMMYTATGNFDRTIQVYQSILEAGLEPDEDTYNTLIVMYCRNKLASHPPHPQQRETRSRVAETVSSSLQRTPPPPQPPPMDPKLTEVAQMFARFKAAYARNDLDACVTLLSQLKVQLTKFPSLPPLFQQAPNSVEELKLARDIYEHAVVLSVKLEDQDAFERDFCQLKPYYMDTCGIIPPSPEEYPILGLNLLRLLVQNRIAEFHTELELLPVKALEHPCIKHAVELEQSFMEGAYNRVLSARQAVPHETYVYFMDLLAKTVRDEIAGCSEKGYDSLSISDAKQMLMFSSDQELNQYITEEHPEWEIKNGSVFFQKAKESQPCKEIPSLQLINQTLSYARELERIV